MAIYWPTPGYKGRTFKLCVLTRWDFNFCVRSSPLRVRGRGIRQHFERGRTDVRVIKGRDLRRKAHCIFLSFNVRPTVQFADSKISRVWQCVCLQLCLILISSSSQLSPWIIICEWFFSVFACLVHVCHSMVTDFTPRVAEIPTHLEKNNTFGL